MKEERAHALQSIRRVGRKLALLLIPLIRQLLARPETFWSAVTEGLENILLAVGLLIAVIAEGRSVRFQVTSRKIRLRSGLLIRRQTQYLRPASCISWTQGLPLRFFHAFRMQLHTALHHPETPLYLSRAQTRHMLHRCAPHPTARPQFRPTPLRFWAAAFAQSNAATGLLVAIPVVRFSAQLFGNELEALQLVRFDPRLYLIQRGLPPLTAALVTGFIIGWAVALIEQLRRFSNFTASRCLNGWLTESGIGIRQLAFTARGRTPLLIRRNLLMHLADAVTLTALPADGSKNHTLLYASSAAQLKDWFRSEWKSGPELVHVAPLQRSRLYACWRELLILTVCLGAVAVGMRLKMPTGLLPFPIGAGILALLHGLLRQFFFSHIGFRCGRHWIAVCRFSRFTLQTMYIPFAQIGQIRLRQVGLWPRGRTCSLRIQAAGRHTVSVSGLPLRKVFRLLHEIPKTFR